MRDMLFLSHANPEDNEIAVWLALRLAKEGYPVWCDLTQLLGGESFWDDIEEAIRERTTKFVYLLSASSNTKPGPRGELQLAINVARSEKLHDFIVPLQIDALAHKDVNILLQGKMTIPFKDSWAHGLQQLLDKLNREKIPKKSSFGPDAVTSWWKSQFNADQGLVTQTDEHISNWFQIADLPKTLFLHSLTRSGVGKFELPSNLSFPGFQEDTSLITFASAKDFEDQLGDNIRINESETLELDQLFNNPRTRNYLPRLLKLAWEHMLTEQKLPIYELANRVKCFYFEKDKVENDTIPFMGVNGRPAVRSVVGYKTMQYAESSTIRYWHFALQAKPLIRPYLAYIIKPHVLFSNDGKMIWDSKARLHAARRSQCRGWWNSDWRDKILAAMTWLGKDNDIVIHLGSDCSLKVSTFPITFTSPVYYEDPWTKGTSPVQVEKDDLTNDEYDDELQELVKQ